MQDLARDNRWGRYYETWAEEPVLAAAIGAANQIPPGTTVLKGLQADDPNVTYAPTSRRP